MINKNISVAIIGCGDIAGGYDERKKGSGIFSHAGAYRAIPHIEITAAYDVNKIRLERFCRYWAVKKGCKSLRQLLEKEYGIISVCVPDDKHQRIIEEIIRSGCTKFIWAEKPLAATAKGAERIIKMATDKGIGLWLNNQRRWEPAHIMIKRYIASGKIGRLLHVTGYYVKGITHIGCTMINTLRFLCGEVVMARAFIPFSEGSYGQDKSLRGILHFENNATAALIGCDGKKYTYSLFEIDIVGTRGRIKIDENGDKVIVYGAKTYDYYPGLRELKLIQSRRTEMKWSMKYGLQLLLKEMRAKKASVETAEEGLTDLLAVEALKKSASKGGINIVI